MSEGSSDKAASVIDDEQGQLSMTCAEKVREHNVKDRCDVLEA